MPDVPHAHAAPRRNADVSWGAFDPEAYWAHNYRQLRDDDRQILTELGRFFSRALPAGPVPRSLDVGSGPNLYPALAVLPFSRRLTLTDYSESNVQWLKEHLHGGAGSWQWDAFWSALCESGEPYRRIADPRDQLLAHAEVQQLSVFDLPPRTWQLGTMFFVAESLTEDPGEYRQAIERFLGALTPGAPFAAAFMEGSLGYTVGERAFPAVAVSSDSIGEVLRPLTTHLEMPPIHTIDPLRPGYSGMVLALGRVA